MLSIPGSRTLTLLLLITIIIVAFCFMYLFYSPALERGPDEAPAGVRRPPDPEALLGRQTLQKPGHPRAAAGGLPHAAAPRARGQVLAQVLRGRAAGAGSGVGRRRQGAAVARHQVPEHARPDGGHG